MPKRTLIKVRGYHLDFYGHINNARYLELLEEARWQWLEGKADLGALQGQGLGFSVVNININYRRPAVLGDILEIETELVVLGNKSGTMRQVVRLQDAGPVVADAEVKFVLVSDVTGRAVPLTGELRGLFREDAGQEA